MDPPYLALYRKNWWCWTSWCANKQLSMYLQKCWCNTFSPWWRARYGWTWGTWGQWGTCPNFIFKRWLPCFQFIYSCANAFQLSTDSGKLLVQGSLEGLQNVHNSCITSNTRINRRFGYKQIWRVASQVWSGCQRQSLPRLPITASRTQKIKCY